MERKGNERNSFEMELSEVNSNNNKTKSLSVNLSVYKLTPKREVLLILNLVWRYYRYEVRTPRRDIFEKNLFEVFLLHTKFSINWISR